MSELKDCGCGRSPTGKCIGWHSLPEEEYRQKLKEFEEKGSELSDKQSTTHLQKDNPKG